MIPRLPTDPAARSRRKQDLLLMSALLRRQAVLAVDDLGERADRWGRRWLWLKARFSAPWETVAGALGGVFTAGPGRRRMLRWGILAWQVWRHWSIRKQA